MSHRRPKFTFVPQTIALLVILTFGYLLSYAPVYRYSPAADAPGAGVLRFVYAPVEHVIDSSPLREPLLVWSDWWGVRGHIEWDSLFRGEDFLDIPFPSGSFPDSEMTFRGDRALPANPGIAPLFSLGH